MFKHRPINPESLEQMRNQLSSTDWSYLENLDINTACSDFSDKMKSLIEQFTPEKEVIIPPKFIIRDEWMTRGLLKSSFKVTRLYKKCVHKPKTDPSYMNYVEYRNTYNKLKRLAKKEYYQERFNKYKNDIKGTWKLLNSLTGRGKQQHISQNTFKLGEKTINRPDDIANEFCKYFTNIGPKLAKEISPPTQNFNTYLNVSKSQNLHSMFLLPTSPIEIKKLIESLKTKKSCGHDNMNTYFLKQISLKFPIL